jgi:uncharacterized membrane protein
MLYLSLKLLHVFLAIVAVGVNTTYGIIIGRAKKQGLDSPEMRFALRTVKTMDDYMANPAYLLLGVTGVAMVHVSGIPWSVRWIHMSLALYAVMAVVAFASYTPTLRKQIAVLESRGASNPEFARLSRRGSMVGGILALLALAIIYLMVFKPA